MHFTYDLISQHTANWAQCLAPFAGQPARALEIGSFEGRSAIWFCENILTHPDSRLICVDTFQWLDAHPVFQANVTEAGVYEKLEILQMSSRSLQLPEESLDFIYVDGDHTRIPVLTDAVLSWRSLKPGGVMIFDDYLLHRGGAQQVKIAVDAFLRVCADELEVLAQGKQVAVRKKKNP